MQNFLLRDKSQNKTLKKKSAIGEKKCKTFTIFVTKIKKKFFAIGKRNFFTSEAANLRCTGSGLEALATLVAV